MSRCSFPAILPFRGAAEELRAWKAELPKADLGFHERRVGKYLLCCFHPPLDSTGMWKTCAFFGF